MTDEEFLNLCEDASFGDYFANIEVAEEFVKMKEYEFAISHLESALKCSSKLLFVDEDERDKIRKRISEIEKMMEADKK